MPAGDGPAGLGARLAPARAVLAAALAALALLTAGGALAWRPALIAAAAIAAVALAAALWGGERTGGPAPEAADADAVPADDGAARLIAALPDAAALLDRDGVVLAANAAALALAPALRRGEPALLALRMPAVVEALRQALATGAPQRAEFAERVPLDRWFEAHAIPTGRLVLMVFRDLTAIRRAEELRADFVANASHELRTPLAALSGFIDTLLGPARDDPAARENFLRIMQEQARRMARLIDDLLSLSRIELNAHVRPQAPVELVAVLRQVVDSLQGLAQERGVTVALAAPAELVVPGDRDELTRLFVNLAENALKYGGDGQRVEITAQRVAAAPGQRAEATVAVRDFGAGIAPEHLPRLTERFYRVDVGKSRNAGGTGLGLALVKHILNRHGGTLAIASTYGAGATFTAHLPLADDSPA